MITYKTKKAALHALHHLGQTGLGIGGQSKVFHSRTHCSLYIYAKIGDSEMQVGAVEMTKVNNAWVLSDARFYMEALVKHMEFADTTLGTRMKAN